MCDAGTALGQLDQTILGQRTPPTVAQIVEQHDRKVLRKREAWTHTHRFRASMHRQTTTITDALLRKQAVREMDVTWAVLLHCLVWHFSQGAGLLSE